MSHLRSVIVQLTARTENTGRSLAIWRMTISTCEDPLVTIVIPAFNAERFVRTAIRSARMQTIQRIQIIVVDDGSTDSTATIVRDEAELDRRVHLHCLQVNSGGSAARNNGFALACGKWIAVLDSDDLMASCRLERLVSEGEKHNADIVADNLARFSIDTNPLTPVIPHADDFTITAEQYIRRNHFFRNSLHYGLLQPIFRAEAVRRASQKYDEKLRIAEDDDFYLRLLLKGLRFRYHASTYYFYRQHPSSVSRIIGVEDIVGMVAASSRVLADFSCHPLRHVLLSRHRALEDAAAYVQLIAALKGKDFYKAAGIAYNRPSSLPLFQTPIRKVVRRFLGSARQPAECAELRRTLQQAMRSAGDPLSGFSPANSEPLTQRKEY